MATKLREQSPRGRLVERHWEARPEALGGRSARRGFTYYAYVPEAIADDDFLLSSHGSTCSRSTASSLQALATSSSVSCSARSRTGSEERRRTRATRSSSFPR